MNISNAQIIAFCVVSDDDRHASRADVGGSVAVLDIMTTAVNPKFVNIMTEILATEIEALGVYENVIAGRDIATMVGFERQREMDDHAECLVNVEPSVLIVGLRTYREAG